nr:hypothetical protein [uncultured Carboxylicivirga sp.]
MKQNNQHIKRASVRFSRWIRKSWAVFNSLGREVSIGHLDVPVAGQALKKTFQGNHAIQLDFIHNEANETTGDDTAEEPESLLQLLLLPIVNIELPSPRGHYSFLHILNSNRFYAGWYACITAFMKRPTGILMSITYLLWLI